MHPSIVVVVASTALAQETTLNYFVAHPANGAGPALLWYSDFMSAYRVRDVLTKEEARRLSRKSNIWGLYAVFSTWGIIFAAMALVVVWPTWIAWVVAAFIIAGRQTAFLILFHDASHYTLFASRRLNHWFGMWFCLYPIHFHHPSLRKNRDHHLKHHRSATTVDDPDLAMFNIYPMSSKKLAFKFLMDLIGVTAFLRMGERLSIDFGLVRLRHGVYELTRVRFPTVLRNAVKTLHGAIITNGVLFGVLLLIGHPQLYLLWVLAWCTFFQVFARLRAMVEHAGLPSSMDPLANSRSMAARWWERMTYAPFHINLHAEHHFLMSVPCNRLPELHRLLRERGALPEISTSERTCFDVLRLVTDPKLAEHAPLPRPQPPAEPAAPMPEGQSSPLLARMAGGILKRLSA